MVGISIKDIEGSKQAMAKAIAMTPASDPIIALHIPKLVPEMMLSSLSDPEDLSDMVSSLPTKAGLNVQKEIKAVVEQECARLAKTVDVKYQVGTPEVDIKGALMTACQRSGASVLFMGPGVGGNGSLPVFAAQKAAGFSVCIVRDHVK